MSKIDRKVDNKLDDDVLLFKYVIPSSYIKSYINWGTKLYGCGLLHTILNLPNQEDSKHKVKR